MEQLRIFVAVAESGSFTKAAKKLYISHSTTSRAVTALETELSLRLFDRGNKVTGLTAAGELLLKEGRELLNKAEELEKKLENLKLEGQKK